MSNKRKQKKPKERREEDRKRRKELFKKNQPKEEKTDSNQPKKSAVECFKEKYEEPTYKEKIQNYLHRKETEERDEARRDDYMRVVNKILNDRANER